MVTFTFGSDGNLSSMNGKAVEQQDGHIAVVSRDGEQAFYKSEARLATASGPEKSADFTPPRPDGNKPSQ